MNLQIDTREKPAAIAPLLKHFDEVGIPYFRSKLYVGDYMSLHNAKRVVDRKHNMSEVAGNVCQGHQRFVAELCRARDAGIELIVLVQHPTIRCVDDVFAWSNPRRRVSPQAISGQKLAKIMFTMAQKYGVRWQFCSSRQMAPRILELLEMSLNDEKRVNHHVNPAKSVIDDKNDQKQQIEVEDARP